MKLWINRTAYLLERKLCYRQYLDFRSRLRELAAPKPSEATGSLVTIKQTILTERVAPPLRKYPSSEGRLLTLVGRPIE